MGTNPTKEGTKAKAQVYGLEGGCTTNVRKFFFVKFLKAMSCGQNKALEKQVFGTLTKDKCHLSLYELRYILIYKLLLYFIYVFKICVS